MPLPLWFVVRIDSLCRGILVVWIDGLCRGILATYCVVFRHAHPSKNYRSIWVASDITSLADLPWNKICGPPLPLIRHRDRSVILQIDLVPVINRPNLICLLQFLQWFPFKLFTLIYRLEDIQPKVFKVILLTNFRISYLLQRSQVPVLRDPVLRCIWAHHLRSPTLRLLLNFVYAQIFWRRVILINLYIDSILVLNLMTCFAGRGLAAFYLAPSLINIRTLHTIPDGLMRFIIFFQRRNAPLRRRTVLPVPTIHMQ